MRSENVFGIPILIFIVLSSSGNFELMVVREEKPKTLGSVVRGPWISS